MQIINLVQGSAEWHEHRATRFNASEAPAMTGESKYMSRDELLHMKKTGEVKEVDSFTQKRFDDGHAAEKAILPHVEKLINAELFPAIGEETVYGLKHLVSASFDGITMTQDIIFEHKLWNQNLVEQINNNLLDDHYAWQLDQQLLLSGAEYAFFACSDGTPQNFVWMKYYPDKERFDALLQAWSQFENDLESYEPQAKTVKPEAAAIMELPALSIEITGGVKNTNLALYKTSAMDFVESINTDLQTDHDFANAEATVKFLGEAEKKIDLVKQQALEQTADISELFRTVDEIKTVMSKKRLTLDKLVKAEKENIKRDILNNAAMEVAEFIESLESDLQGNHIREIEQREHISKAMKGKRTIDSLRSAANDMVATLKIEATQQAQLIKQNFSIIPEEYNFLFSDMNEICRKPFDDFSLLVKSRIAEHKEAEEKRLEAEREKIREEEQRKAQEAEKEREIKRQLESDSPIIDPDICIPKGVEVHQPEIKDGDSVPVQKFIDEECKEEALSDIIDSLIENGIGKQTARKVGNLIIDAKIKRVTFN